MAGLDVAFILVPVAAGDAAGGVYQNRLMRHGVGARQQRLRRAALVQAREITVPKGETGFAA